MLMGLLWLVLSIISLVFWGMSLERGNELDQRILRLSLSLGISIMLPLLILGSVAALLEDGTLITEMTYFIYFVLTPVVHILFQMFIYNFGFISKKTDN